MSSAGPPVRAVLFDFDGTLVDSEYLHHESWLEAVEPWGVTLPWEDYKRQLVGLSDRRACEFFLGLAGLEPTPERTQAGRAGKHKAYRRRSVEELSVDVAVRDWIHSHHGRVPMAVISSSATPDVVPILERQGVADRMEFVICGEHVERLKPDPMPYLLACKRLRASHGIEDCRECLVFEDSQTGILSAEAAGTTVHALNSPSDLPAALVSWNERILETAPLAGIPVPSEG